MELDITSLFPKGQLDQYAWPACNDAEAYWLEYLFARYDADERIPIVSCTITMRAANPIQVSAIQKHHHEHTRLVLRPYPGVVLNSTGNEARRVLRANPQYAHDMHALRSVRERALLDIPGTTRASWFVASLVYLLERTVAWGEEVPVTASEFLHNLSTFR